ncbi:MAG: DUF6893 family small protein [Pyrinomonadaceae bacterium]
MERQKSLERRDHRIARRKENDSSSAIIWSAIGGIALLGAAALFYVNLPDLKRYIKMSRM